MKYAFIDRHRSVWPVCVQCRVLGVSATGYHRRLLRRVEIAERRHMTDEALVAHIRAVYAEMHGAYGWPHIWRELRKRGVRVGKQRVQRLMQKHGIRARGKRRFRMATTDSRHTPPVAPLRLERNFSPARPDTAWSGDITYIATDEGWLFLAVVIDLFSRRVVGWSLPKPQDQRYPRISVTGQLTHRTRIERSGSRIVSLNEHVAGLSTMNLRYWVCRVPIWC